MSVFSPQDTSAKLPHFGQNGTTSMPLAIFDIDGTIFRSSLMLELFRGMVKCGLFPPDALAQTNELYQAWLNRQNTYTAFKDAFVRVYFEHIQNVRVESVRRVSAQVMEEQKQRVYVFTRNLLNALKNTHILIAISASPAEIVREFQQHWGFNFAFGSEYEHQNGAYTGTAEVMNEHNKKIKLKELMEKQGYNLAGSVGVGDTESDIYFLRMVERSIAFNPNQQLYEYARSCGWEIVVERKDVIYHLPPSVPGQGFEPR